jgi:hypothetical protein
MIVKEEFFKVYHNEYYLEKIEYVFRNIRILYVIFIYKGDISNILYEG